MRVLRIDGKQADVEWTHASYHRTATARLIAIFDAHPLVKKIYFNDRKAPGVLPLTNHDNHFHIEVTA